MSDQQPDFPGVGGPTGAGPSGTPTVLPPSELPPMAPPPPRSRSPLPRRYSTLPTRRPGPTGLGDSARGLWR